MLPSMTAALPSVSIAWVAYKGVHEQNALTIPDLRHLLRSRAHNSKLDCIYNDALICRSRSRILSQFLSDPQDVCLMVDHDIQAADPADLLALCDHAVSQQAILGVPFALRGTPINWAGRLPDSSVPQIGQDQFIDATYVGTLMAVPKPALKRVLGHCLDSRDHLLRITRCNESRQRIAMGGPHHLYDFCRPSPIAHPDGSVEYLSEEWAFQERARAAGVPIRAWLKPRILHHGNHPFSLTQCK